MARRGVKGFVLAAGFGTRLRPLTDLYPKPLVPFAGTNPLELALWRLAEAGIKENAINSHHRQGDIAAYVHANPLALALTLSHEATILGTGGAYNPLRQWLGDADLVVLNGDVVSTIDVAALLRSHQDSGAVATMALLPEVIPGESGVYHAGAKVLGIGRQPPPAAAVPTGLILGAGNFACAQVLSPAFLELLPTGGSFDVISKGYVPALARGMPVGAWVHSGFWHDLRTPQYYWEALQDLLSRPGAFAATGVAGCRLKRGLKAVPIGCTLVDADDTASPAQLRGCVVVERGAKLHAKLEIENALLLPGAETAGHSRIAHQIIGAGLEISLNPT